MFSDVKEIQTYSTVASLMCVVNVVMLTVGITYSQLGRILHVLYDSNAFDFPQLSISVLSQTVTSHVGLKGTTHQANITP